MWSFRVILELSITFLITVIFVYYIYYLYCFTYWKKRGVPSANPIFPFGDLRPSILGQKSIFVHLKDLYDGFKANGYQHGGLYYFNGPVYLVIDPALIKRILVTDFNYFADRGMYMNQKDYPLTYHMFSMPQELWRNSRVKFSPLFTAGKMKSMFHILTQNGIVLTKILKSHADHHQVIDIKDILVRFTVDNIGCAVFGIDCKSMENADVEFNRMVVKIFNQPLWRLFLLFLMEGGQNPGNLLKISHSDKTVEKFFFDLMRNTIEHRKRNNIVRDDFLNILMQMKDKGLIKFDEIVAQSYLFFTAGYETSSSTMAFCLHELALNQALQNALRKEIHSHLGKDCSKYDFDGIMNLPLLDKVVKETLRKYPTNPLLNRICLKNYHVPGTDVTIERNTPVLISILALHRDPEYFPQPLKFDPERFNGENDIVPFTYLPFGDGPRNCIGLRFGLMQAKLGLATVLCNFKFIESFKTPRELQFDIKNTTIVLNPLNTIYTKIVNI